MSHMPPDLHTYLCSFCNRLFQAPAGAVDRTKQTRCPACVRATPDLRNGVGGRTRRRKMKRAVYLHTHQVMEHEVVPVRHAK